MSNTYVHIPSKLIKTVHRLLLLQPMKIKQKMKPPGVDGDNGTSTWLTAGVLKPIEFIPRSEEAPNVPNPYLMQKQTESSLEVVLLAKTSSCHMQ